MKNIFIFLIAIIMAVAFGCTPYSDENIDKLIDSREGKGYGQVQNRN